MINIENVEVAGVDRTTIRDIVSNKSWRNLV